MTREVCSKGHTLGAAELAMHTCFKCHDEKNAKRPKTLQEKALLIVRLFDAIGNRYSVDHDDPLIGPIAAFCHKRYEELKYSPGHDFTYCNVHSRAEAVERLMEIINASPETQETQNQP